MCDQRNIFCSSRSIPIEFKILVGLRILGRGNCADDVEEMSEIPESSCNFIFKQFVNGFADSFFDEYVYFPEGAELDAVMKTYEQMGFPLAAGSMDCTHVRLGKCPEGFKILCTGGVGGGVEYRHGVRDGYARVNTGITR